MSHEGSMASQRAWWSRSLGRFAFRGVVVAIYGFLVSAPIVVVAYSFSPSVVLRFPPEGVTLAWYRAALAEPRLLSGVGYSTLVAAGSTALAVTLGVPAAYALSRGRFPGRQAASAFLLSPLILPGLVLAIGLLVVLVGLVQPALGVSLIGTVWPLLAAHLIVTIPWVVRTVMASLTTMDPAVEEAARGLGATPLVAFFLVTLPAIAPGIAAGAIFAFIVSFGNFALSLFFASANVVTLPVAIFEYIDRFQDPTVAAVSSLVIVGTTAIAIIADRLVAMGSPPRRRVG